MKIIVTGMHRSGTAAIAGLIAAAGVPAGDGDERAIRDANDRVLAALGWSWDAPPPTPPASPPDRPQVVEALRALVSTELGDGPWLIRDPRLSLLLPIWRRVVPDRCILVVADRPLDEIAGSLFIRDGIPVPLGRALGRAYGRHLATGAAGLPVVQVGYPGLVMDPAATARSLLAELAALGAPVDPERAEAAARTIDPRLRRTTQPGRVDEPPAIDRPAVAVVDAAALDGLPATDEDVALLELQRRHGAALRLAAEHEAAWVEARSAAETAEVELAWVREVADEARAGRRAAEAEVRHSLLEGAERRQAASGELLRELLALAAARPRARLRTLFLRARLRLGLPNPLFDAAWYRAAYPDLPRGPGRAWIHWRRHGWREGRDPAATFRTAWYRRENPDVAARGVDPLAHYLLHGWREGRDPSPEVRGDDYLRRYPDVAAMAICPLLHHRRHGAAEGRTLAPGPAPRA